MLLKVMFMKRCSECMLMQPAEVLRVRKANLIPLPVAPAHLASIDENAFKISFMNGHMTNFLAWISNFVLTVE